MKWINNVSVKLKLILMVVPLMIGLIAAVIFAAVSISSTENEVTHVYYDVLYSVNNSLVSGDRDFYQALMGATQYYDMANGYSSLPGDQMKEQMSANVGSVKDASGNISGRITSLTEAQNGLRGIISDLSAISEENAASTEETNASMEELNATFTMISDSAGKLEVIANDLTDTISYFKT